MIYERLKAILSEDSKGTKKPARKQLLKLQQKKYLQKQKKSR